MSEGKMDKSIYLNIFPELFSTTLIFLSKNHIYKNIQAQIAK